MTRAALVTGAGPVAARHYGEQTARTPVGRLGTIEVAAACRYLCRDDAGFVTGQTLAVNGGLHM